jgi:hypothetical protein
LVFTADLPTLNGASDREKGMAMRATLVAGWIVLFGLTAAVVAEDDGSSLAVPAASDAAEVAEEPIPEPIQEPIPDPIPEPEAAEPPAPDAAAEPAPAPAPAAHRVTVDIGVSGELFAPTGPDAEPVRQPIAVDARFDFIERSGTGTATVVRDYAEAAATVRVADQPARVDLPADARRVEVALRGTTPAPYLGDGFLSREELDLLDTPFDAVLLDRLLPAEPVAIGAKWTVAPDAAAGLLAIDTLETGGLDAELTAVDGTTATVRLTGIIDGAADGVPTHLVVEGDCTLAAAPVDAQWRLTATRVAAVTIRERRQASHVAPGFDVEARVSVSRRPHEAQTAAAAPTAEGTGRRRGAGRPGLVWHRDPAGRYDLVHDARWRVVEDAPTGLVMRLVDRGALVGQCSLTALPRGDALAPPTIAEVQRDVERSLAGQFGRFEHASEATRSDGVRIVRVVSTGTAEKLPFRWIHHVLTDAEGRRAAATFMLEASAAGRFAEADRELIDGFGFPAAEPAGSGPVAAEPVSPPDREARAPRGTVQP